MAITEDINVLDLLRALKEDVVKRFDKEEILMKPIEPDVLLETAARRICE